MTLINELREAVIDGDSEKSTLIAKNIVKKGLDINHAIVDGLNSGMKKVSELYREKEYFLPEIIVAADSLYAALDVFKPHINRKETQSKINVVIGVVRGDIHDIGKNLTKLFLEASGYNVIDCGRNVKNEDFINAIKENDANILALSTLMSPTLESITDLVKELKKEDLLNRVKILIGGAATSEEFAQKIGVKYCENSIEALKYIDKMRLQGEI
jgi:methanogenic corrinoid protein MtbC1